MIEAALSIISVCSYLGCAAFIIRGAPQHVVHLSGWLGVLTHLFYIGAVCQQQQGFSYGFFSTASLISVIVALLLLIAMMTKPVAKLGIIVFPAASVILVAGMFFPGQTHNLHTHNWEMGTHILASIIAFSLLNIAALQALLLAFQDQQLRSHPPKPFILSLPPLQTMESLLFQMLSAGVLFLSISLVSGFLFIEDLFAQHLVHKTVLSLLAWIIFTSLLIGRWLYGWRGRTATKLTLSGFMLLILAYFGSKFVLELLLNKV